MYIWTRVTKGY